EFGMDGGHLEHRGVESAQHDRRAGKFVDRDVEHARHEALHPQLTTKGALLDRGLDIGLNVTRRDTSYAVWFQIDIDSDQRFAPADLHVLHFANTDTPHQHRRALLKAGHRGVEIHHVAKFLPEQTGAAPEQQAGHEHDGGAEDEGADHGRVGAYTHTAAPPAATSTAPRRRNVRTVGFGLSSRSVLGLP